MNYFVYMLRCADGTYYIGQTKDLSARVDLHNAGKGAKYTRGRLPVVLVYSEPAPDRGAALRREYKLKKMTRAQKQELPARAGTL